MEVEKIELRSDYKYVLKMYLYLTFLFDKYFWLKFFSEVGIRKADLSPYKQS